MGRVHVQKLDVNRHDEPTPTPPRRGALSVPLLGGEPATGADDGAPLLGGARAGFMESITLETAVQPKETKEAKEFEGFTQTRTLTCRVNGA